MVQINANILLKTHNIIASFHLLFIMNLFTCSWWTLTLFLPPAIIQYDSCIMRRLILKFHHFKSFCFLDKTPHCLLLHFQIINYSTEIFTRDKFEEAKYLTLGVGAINVVFTIVSVSVRTFQHIQNIVQFGDII